MNMEKEQNGKKNNKIDPEIKKLILWRIETSTPANFKLSIGGKGALNKEELKKHVEAEDSTGLQIVKMQLNFIKALSSGEFAKVLAE